MLSPAGTAESQSGFIKTIAKPLRPHVVFRRTYVDKHPALLKHVNSPIKITGKYISFEASRTLGNVLKNGSVEDVHPSIDKTRSMGTGFLRESHYAARGINTHRSVAHLICNRTRHAR